MPGHRGIKVKMCGLTAPQQAEWAVSAGSAYIGLVFFEPSPRNVAPALARDIALAVPTEVTKVALLVDPDDELVGKIASLPINMLQLHGKESPDRVSQIKAQTGLQVMKAVGVRTQDDLEAIETYAAVADQVLVDAKPPAGARLPGGNGLSFDWKLMAGRTWSVPWMLAGGLTPENVALAIERTGTVQVDVSSGIEAAPGEKSQGKIDAFMDAVRAVEHA